MNKRITFCTLLLILPLSLILGADDIGLRRFGLFVGSNDGGRERVTLSYAATDASMVKSVMEEVGGIAAADAILLRDPDSFELSAGFDRIRQSIIAAKQSSRRVEFVLYYSGHSDEHGILLGGERFTYLDLRNHIQAIPADVNIAVLDSCSSGAFTRLKGGSRGTPFLVDESVTTKGHAYITSSSETEAAQESDTIGASFFTHFLVSGLRGAADSTNDGKVTLNEAYSHALDETLARTSTTLAGPQHATHEFRLAGSGDVVLTDLRVASAGIVFDQNLSGRMFVTGANGKLVAEIRKAAGSELTLALPPGRYQLTLDTGSELREGAIALNRSGRIDVSSRDLTARAPEIARERGNGPKQDIPDQDLGEEIARQVEERVATVFGAEFNPVEVASRITESLVHLDYLFSFIPERPKTDENRVVHDLSLNIIGSSYRVEGLDLGLVNIVREDVKGAQIAGLAGFIGDDLYGGQVSGLFNINGGRIFGAQIAGVFNIASGRIYGAQASGVFNLAGGNVQSAQIAGVLNVASGSVYGAQVGGVLNTADGPVNGAQVGGVFNVANGSINGAQVGGVFNIADGAVYGAQVAGVFNVSDGNINGVKLAGVFDVNSGTINGLQGAGVFSFNDGDVHGVQLGSIFNVAENISGAQIGLLNIGANVYGTQIGLINISERMYGVPIGLINISGNGLFNPSLWSDDTGFTYAGMQFGAGPLYTLLFAGTPVTSGWTEASLGIGVGIHAKFGNLFLDFDLSAKSFGTGTTFDEAIQNSALPFYDFSHAAYETGNIDGVIGIPFYPSARLQIGFTLFNTVSLLAGVTLESLVSPDQVRNPYFHKGEPWVVPLTDLEFDALLFPRWYFGLRI